MAELLSVGLDVGTTTTQLIVSKLLVENQASSFSVPKMEITQREILYKSPVHVTPLQSDTLVDGQALRELVSQEYQKAGITRDTVDTGAVIITGETSRKENARTVLDKLSEYAGDFVVATAGPDLESVLAARGAGAVELSEGSTVLHMDIGGGTSNLAYIENGKILHTGCLNVGGRLIKFDKNHRITYISPELRGLTALHLGDTVTAEILEPVAGMLTDALEAAAGLRQDNALLDRMWTKETPRRDFPKSARILSFSGGVADCILEARPWDAFGDLGPILGKTIKRSALCAGDYRLGCQTIRATVIGAGCHSAQLSGSTVFYRGVQFPLKNLPAVPLTELTEDAARQALTESDAVLFLPPMEVPPYSQIRELAKILARGIGSRPAYIAMAADMAKALGQALALELPPHTPCLCIDGVLLEQGSYLDVAAPVGPALPVVIKTLVLGGAYGKSD